MLLRLLPVILLCFPFYLQAQTKPLQVVVSVRPVALLVQELTQGLTVEVNTLLPQGATPHDYALKPSDIKAIAAADVVVWMGAVNEPYLKGAVAKAKTSVDWSAQPGLIRLPLRETMHGDHHDHAHHGGHEHANAAYDLHFWMSLDNALLLADAVEQSLKNLRPSQSTTT